MGGMAVVELLGLGDLGPAVGFNSRGIGGKIILEVMELLSVNQERPVWGQDIFKEVDLFFFTGEGGRFELVDGCSYYAEDSA